MLRSLIIASLFVATAGHAQRYSATILQTPDGRLMAGGGLNNRGDVVGGVSSGALSTPLLRRADGSFVDLGTLGGNSAYANAISDNGLIAGQARAGMTGATSRPTLQADGGAIQAIMLPAGGSGGQALDVNEAGAAVGVYRVFDTALNREVTRGFRWNGSTLETLPVDLGTFSRVEAVNAAGVAVVNAARGRFRWNADGSLVALAAPAVAPGGFSVVNVNDINDTGFSAGDAYSTDWGFDANDRMVVWDASGAIVRLSDPSANDAPLFAYSINNRGVVVGQRSWIRYALPGGGIGEDPAVAMLWRPGGQLVDLNTLVSLEGVRLESANDINDRGQILASGLRGGIRVDVLLTPVPEPGTWALMIAGFGMVGFAARRRMAVRAG